MHEKELFNAYKKIFCNTQPVWAQKKFNNTQLIYPTIPFIGKNYDKYRVLIYASAENLTYINKEGGLENDVYAINRHRNHFEHSKNNEGFPEVHCQPITDGGLTLAAAYICQKLNIDMDYKEPKDFFECVSFGNFGKFSVQSDYNKDYAKDIDKLKTSFDFIRADLSVLLPEYIIMPKTIFNNKCVKNLLSEYIELDNVVRIYQINAGVVNRTIKKLYPDPKKECDLRQPLLKWYEDYLDKPLKTNFLHVFAYLDKELQNIN